MKLTALEELNARLLSSGMDQDDVDNLLVRGASRSASGCVFFRAIHESPLRIIGERRTQPRAIKKPLIYQRKQPDKRVFVLSQLRIQVKVFCKKLYAVIAGNADVW